MRAPCSITAFWSASLIDLTGLEFLEARETGPSEWDSSSHMYVACPRGFHRCGDRIITSFPSYNQAHLLRSTYF